MSRLIRLGSSPERVLPCAVCIGNFDGVHAGHQALIEEVLKLSHRLRVSPSALTFEPHPTEILAPSRAPKLLTTIEQRARILHHLGIEQVLVLRFDKALSEMSPAQFARNVLRDFVSARAVVVGEDFRFGHKQTGTFSMLSELGEELGFEAFGVAGVHLRGRRVASSEIRSLIQAGRIGMAGRLLLRPYSLSGAVAPGFGVGSRETVPTLNLTWEEQVLPGAGVYVTRTHDRQSARAWESITNVGIRPTFDGSATTVETHLLSPFEGNAPERIQVDFLRYLRPEHKFESPAELKAQIMRDIGRANAYHRRIRRWVQRVPCASIVT